VRRALYMFMVCILFSCSDAELVSMQQINNGAKLYETHCSNCHQADGSGLALLIPPLKQSDYLVQNANDLPCIIKKGIQGEISVNGNLYNQKMPANEKLSEKDIMDICLFVLQKFPEKPILMPADSIEKCLHHCLANSH
jgi:cytochrome c551